ncbi:MAG: DUF1801 domain-containing protein [Flavobacteriaceae bacterium]
MDKPNSVEEYLRDFPENVQVKLRQMRSTIQENAPSAEESISYGMPAYKLGGKPLFYFAGFKNHIGFYATPTGHQQFQKELSIYKQGKGSVQFPIDQPLPIELIRRIVWFRAQENLNKVKSR